MLVFPPTDVAVTIDTHHFVGKGLVSDTLRERLVDPDRVLATGDELITASGLEVVTRLWAGFDRGGVTLVWVLAESHLVLHYWADEGVATLDLHVCDYHERNRVKAQGLLTVLRAFCFRTGSDSWRELHP